MMKKTQSTQPHKISEEMAAEYHFDYSKARPNRFVDRMTENPLVVVLEPDVAEVFTTSEAVNKALRALIDAVPPRMKTKPAIRQR